MSHPSKRRVGPILLAFAVPGAGYFALGRWRRGVAFVVLLSAITTLAAYSAAAGVAVGVIVGLVLSSVLLVASVIDVGRAPAELTRRPSTWAIVGACVALAVSANLEALAYRANVVEAFHLPSGSMIPTLQVGDHFFADKRAHTPKRGDIVVFPDPKQPSRQFVKRVLAVGGDTIEFRDGAPIVNGAPLPRTPVPGPCTYDDFDEDSGAWLTRNCSAFDEVLDGRRYRVVQTDPALDLMRNRPAVTVPPGTYFVVGDNRDGSFDSRAFGPIRSIDGLVRLVFWSRHAGQLGAVR